MLGLAKKSLGFMFKDPIILILSLIPPCIGVALYFLLGSWLLHQLEMGQTIISNFVANQTLQAFVHYLVLGICLIMFFLVVNFTFLLVVSLVAAPFNTLMSARVEKLLVKRMPETAIEKDPGNFFSKFFSSITDTLWQTLWNETKKLIFIVFLSVVAIFMGFIPFLSPFAFALTATLYAIQFLDYSWSRYDYTLGQSMKDLMKHFKVYLLPAALFTLGMGVPFLNLFLLSYSVVYFTVLFTDGQRSLSRIE